MSDAENGATFRINDMESGNEKATAAYIHESVHASIEMELKRCESLRKMSGTILTCGSVISVALVTAAGPLFEFFRSRMELETVLLTVMCLSLVALFVSIVLALISQLRFAYVSLPNPSKILKALDNGNLFTEMEIARHYSEGADEIYVGLSERNNIMRGLLTAAAIAIFVSVGFLLAGAICLVPCAFGLLR